jgi:hypothetical protein
MRTPARTLLVAAWTALAFGLPAAPAPVARPAEAPASSRIAYLLHGLDDEEVVAATAAVAAADPGAVVLLDSEASTAAVAAFLTAYRPGRVVPVVDSPDVIHGLEERLGCKIAAPGAPPPQTDAAVVCPAAPRRLLLQAACLAGAARARLCVLRGGDEPGRLAACLTDGGVKRAYLVGDAPDAAAPAGDCRVTRLADEDAVIDAYLRRLGEDGPVETLVVANPDDACDGCAALSSLAPWVALQKRAALVLTDDDGTDAAARVEAAVRRGPLRDAESVILLGDLGYLPTEKRPNPLPGGKDAVIEMEPLTPAGDAPFSFAVGRLFHDDPAVVLLILARERLLAGRRGKRKALVASNPGGSLALLEAFSRNTAFELGNSGYETTALFGKDIDPVDLRERMTESDVFLWEGHHNALMRDYRFPEWDEPLPPALVFVQSCLALKGEKVGPLLRRGAVGVVGASTRTYSGSGGACSLAFFDALLYDGRTVGGSLRQAKNFLLCYALLKQKMLGEEAPRAGANRRSAWAFSLWGDPTLTLPRPDPPAGALPPVRCAADGDRITLTAPEESHPRVDTGKYQVEMPPNARLAGLIRRGDGDEPSALVPFLFAEVRLDGGRPGQVPVLHGRLPASHWVFLWDDRRRTGYLLVAPRARDERAVRFRVEWRGAETAER